MLLGHFATAGWDSRLAEALAWAITCGPPVKHSTVEDIEAVMRLVGFLRSGSVALWLSEALWLSSLRV